MIDLVQHPKSGETYIFEQDNGQYRAIGPMYHGDLPMSQERMQSWLDNAPFQDELQEDGEWLAEELRQS